MTEPTDNTRTSGSAPDSASEPQGVRGGDADRMDPGPLGGVPAAGADGETAAREELRKDLGERAPTAGTEDGDDLEQAAAIGEADDPQGGSIQEPGARP
ncbi:MAG: hypothetical protein ACR2K2_06250 [Mycobacteriales bacterium]